MSIQPNDVIFRNVTLPDGRSIGTARIVIHALASVDGEPSRIRVGVWRQRQGMIERAYVGDVVEVETSVGQFQVPKSSQQLTVTVSGGAVLVGRELGCQCGSLPHLVVPEEF